MMKAAVIGHPVAQSLSPLIHTSWLRQYAIEGFYEAIDIAPADLSRRFRVLSEQGYKGCNVTIPHKQSVMDLCDILEDTAKAIGAVNTVVFEKNGVRGLNTDAFGLIENLRTTLPGFSVRGKKVIVLGAGGAARAALYALQQDGVQEIILTNRTLARAEECAGTFPGVKVEPWDRRSKCLSDCALLVNTTSLGMAGQEPLDIDLSALPQGGIVYDIVYKPLMTGLLQQAAAHGHPVVTGIGMLLQQARAAFAAWTGIMPTVTQELTGIVTERAR